MFDSLRAAKAFAASVKPTGLDMPKHTMPRGTPVAVNVGLDVGQTHDPAALAITLRFGAGASVIHRVRFLHLWKLGTEYERIVDDTLKWTWALPATLAKQDIHITPENVALVWDHTGIGRAIGELIQKKARAEVMTGSINVGTKLVPLSITGGNLANQDEKRGEWRVPKRDLIEVMLAVVGTGRIEHNRQIKFGEKLLEQLGHFVGIVQRNGYERFEASSDRFGDDLVLALSYCLWWGEKRRGGSPLIQF